MSTNSYYGEDQESKCDPHTGWGGFADHHAKKHFDSFEEQHEWYESRRKAGLTTKRSSWDEEE
jgi:hypothetical protein